MILKWFVFLIRDTFLCVSSKVVLAQGTDIACSIHSTLQVSPVACTEKNFSFLLLLIHNMTVTIRHYTH